MATSRVVAVIATLDTKREEAEFLRDRLRAGGYDARVVDTSARAASDTPGASADVGRAAVLAAAGVSSAALAAMRRDEAMAAMGRGAGAILRAWYEDGRLAGALGIGGNQGTAIGAIAMRMLPFGVPRVLVSTVASGNLRPFIGAAEIAVVPSVGDLLGGPNRVTRPVLVRAAAMLAGMVAATNGAAADVLAPPADFAAGQHDINAVGPGAGAGADDPGRSSGAAEEPIADPDVPAVAITAFGNTHGAVTEVMARLRAGGCEVVPFHASGAGGTAMETFVRDGLFRGVVDLTPHELLGEVLGDDIYAPVEPGRLTAAGLAGVPQVVAPGGLDYFAFGPEDTIPPRYRGRAIHRHNPYNTNVRAAAGELARVGEVLARRLNAARGPAAFLYPCRGWSVIGSQDGPLWDAAANEALRASLRRALRPQIRYLEIDAPINDPGFAAAAAATMREFLEARGGVRC